MDLNSTTDDWKSRVEDFSDRWNPMLVREIRRTLKSKAFAATFLLLVISCAVAAYLMVIQAGPAIRYLESGRQFSIAFFGLLSLPLFFVVPYSLFAVTSQEHGEQTLDMMSITTLKTEDILWGYLTCGFAHAIFYLCAIGPFICFSYLLRGVGISQILGSVFTLMLFTITTLYWGTMLGCCAKGSISRVICSILTIFGGFIALSLFNSMNGFILSGNLNGLEWIGGLTCFALVLTPCMVIMYAVARQQLLLIDPVLKPYRVLLNDQGEVLRFQPRYHGVYQGHVYTPTPEMIAPSSHTPPAANSGSSQDEHTSGP